MLHAINIALVSWVLYCAIRVVIAPRNAIQVGANVLANTPNDFAFQTYMKVREFYLQLSPGHKKYELRGTELLKDVVIDVWEEAGFQFVKHQYRVSELIPPERMKLVSESSQVKVLGLFRGQTRSEVVFRFTPTADSKTTLGLAICIVFSSKLRQFLARLFFTEAIWQAHAKQEMKALARLIEQRYAKAA
ncbi:MAG TPA: hypothetical protein DDY20_01675 [Desulfobulbaceae bacterium]|nr:hypothetical protein [Desulfobulbaceae bacterium]